MSGDILRKISKLVARNAPELIALQRVNKKMNLELQYMQPYMNLLWENITRMTFGDQIPEKLRAKKWNKLYKHYHTKSKESNTQTIEMDLSTIETVEPVTRGLPSGFQWDFPCDLEFEDMKSTGCDDVKYCDKCSRHVYEIEMTGDYRKTLREAIKDGVCVAITKKKGYEINGVWYDRQTRRKQRRKSKWVYNGQKW
eukprot:339884_1